MIRPTALLGANAERTRAHNRRLVLSGIRAAGPLGRAEIARASGLSTQAVSNIVEALVDEGWLAPAGAVRAGRGLPAMQYALVPGGAHAVGLELRPDAILGALLDLEGRAVATARRPVTDATPGPLARQAAALVADLVAQAGPAPLLGAGAAIPDPFGPTGLAPEGGELPGWAELDAATHLGAALGLPVIATKDAVAAAMAERVGGAARGLRHHAQLYFGSGIGLALVTDGAPMTGARGNAGEIGRLPLPGGGTLEGAASRLALTAALTRHGARAASSDDIAALAAQDHPAVLAWLDAAAPALAFALLLVENIADPETVILGGALPPALLERLVARVALPGLSVAARPHRALPRLMVGRCGPTIAAQGAAALVLDAADAPVARLQAAE